MPELCFNSAKFLKRWFDNLASIQAKMADMNHLTKTNLREFSKQTLEELLMPSQPGIDIRKKNLNLHCDRSLGLYVPYNAYDDMKKNYLWFLEHVAGVTARDRLLTIFYCVAHNLNPGQFPSDTRPADFHAKSISEAYQNLPFEENDILKKLHRMLADNIDPAFYRDTSVLKKGDASIEDVMQNIITGKEL